MSFLEHLETLRWHLVRSTIAVLVLAVVAFMFKNLIFDTILFAPKDPQFITYRILCNITKFFGFDESACISEIPFRLQNRTMAGQFNLHIWTAITAGIIIAFPYILYEMWKFISPALKDNEKKHSRGFIAVASFLFFIGVLFGYYIVAPLAINFLGSYTVSSDVHNDIDITSYMGLIRSSALASGVVFELPIIIYILSKLGLVNPQMLRQYRKFSIVGILIISAVITPPDITSQVIVAIPLLILYEISILISKMVVKKEEKKERELAV